MAIDQTETIPFPVCIKFPVKELSKKLGGVIGSSFSSIKKLTGFGRKSRLPAAKIFRNYLKLSG